MTSLFDICDGILDADDGADNICSVNYIAGYAEAVGADINADAAEEIMIQGAAWLWLRKNGDGNWSELRHTIRRRLNDAEIRIAAAARAAIRSERRALSAAGRAMGLIGGATKSPERAAASRENGRLGGRPKYQYNITSRDGETQGTYAGVTPAHALAAMYRVAGYRVRVNRSGKLIFADDGAQDLCGQIDDWIIRQVK